MEMRKAAEAAPITPTTKVRHKKDICKILAYFRYKTATTLDAMLATGVLRNSITWYVRDLERWGELQVVCVKPDKHTKRMAKYYSADRSKWPHKPQKRELCLFPDFDGMEVRNGI